MFFNKLYSKGKKITCLLSTLAVAVATFSAITIPFNGSVTAPFKAYAEESTVASNKSSGFSSHKFADIDLQVSVSKELVCFTQNVTSNNSYLQKIGADNAEELRTSMTAQNIYLEAIPMNSDVVNYEIIIVGDKIGSDGITDLNSLSESELNATFEDYTDGINKKNDSIEETLVASEIYKHNDTTYFVTEVSTVSAAKVPVQLKKYYTIKNGYYYTFTIQTTEKSITADMKKQLTDIVNSAEYKEIKKSIFDNAIFSELASSVITLLAPIAILGLILFVLIKMTSKKKVH